MENNIMSWLNPLIGQEILGNPLYSDIFPTKMKELEKSGPGRNEIFDIRIDLEKVRRDLCPELSKYGAKVLEPRNPSELVGGWRMIGFLDLKKLFRKENDLDWRTTPDHMVSELLGYLRSATRDFNENDIVSDSEWQEIISREAIILELSGDMYFMNFQIALIETEQSGILVLGDPGFPEMYLSDPEMILNAIREPLENFLIANIKIIGALPETKRYCEPLSTSMLSGSSGTSGLGQTQRIKNSGKTC